jgi:hypothetical protein
LTPTQRCFIRRARQAGEYIKEAASRDFSTAIPTSVYRDERRKSRRGLAISGTSIITRSSPTPTKLSPA